MSATHSSATDLVSSESTQAIGVGSPGGGRVGGDAPIVVEVYALGRGVALEGDGGDLLCREGAFELEAHGKVFIFNPLGACHAYGLVTPIERNVTTVIQPLETVNQKHLSEFRNCAGHGGHLKTAILSLPAGYGKSNIASKLAAKIGCTNIVGEWAPGKPITPNALHLTNEPVLIGGAA